MLTPELVRGWFRGRQVLNGSRAVVGYRRVNNLCPLACCLNEQPGVEEGTVYPSYYAYWGEIDGVFSSRVVRIEPGSWEEKFIELVDSPGVALSSCEDKLVSAEDALKYLDEALKVEEKEVPCDG